MDNAMHLFKLLKKAPRSFEAIRKHTPLKLTDAQFNTLITENPKLFAPARFIKKDEAGNRVKPGAPGVKRHPASTATA